MGRGAVRTPAAAMPLNSKIYMPFNDAEPPKSKNESSMTMLEFCKKGGIDKTLKSDAGRPAKHLYEHTVQVRWGADGGPLGKEVFSKKKRRAAPAQLLPCACHGLRHHWLLS